MSEWDEDSETEEWYDEEEGGIPSCFGETKNPNSKTPNAFK